MRKYAIVADTSCEITEEIVPFKIDIDNHNFVDDENLDVDKFIDTMLASQNPVKTACPSPGDYQEALEKNADAEELFIITISSKLSGSYHSACIGRDMFLEDHADKKVHVIDSKSAVAGETLVYLKLVDILKENLAFDEIVKKLEKFRNEMNTYFVLDNLETLRKNGRLTGVKALVASTLSIKPVMGALEGNIIQKGQAIGIKKALAKMSATIAKEVVNPETKRLMITHCNCLERAELLKSMLLELISVKSVLILDTAGISSMYANDGGVIVTI